MIFSPGHVWMWELDYKESWVPKNWCFWTVVLEKTFESPLDGKEIQPIHPKGNQSEYSLEGLMLNLKLQYFGHCEKTLMLGKIEGRRRRGQQRMRWLDGITYSMDMIWVGSGSWWWTGMPGMLQSMGSQRVEHNWVTELNWRDSGESFRNKTMRSGTNHSNSTRIHSVLLPILFLSGCWYNILLLKMSFLHMDRTTLALS